MELKFIFEKFTPQKDNLLLILHEIQKNNPENFISKEDVDAVAKYLNVSTSSVAGVIGYYSMFSDKPRGENVIRVCSSPVCSMLGSEHLSEVISKILNIAVTETTTDKKFTLEFAECLGHCHVAPVMMINDKVYGNLNFDKITEVLTQF